MSDGSYEMRRTERRQEFIEGPDGVHEKFGEAIPQTSKTRAREAAMKLGKRTLDRIGPDLVEEFDELQEEIYERRQRQKEIRRMLEVAGISLEDYR